MLAEFGRMDRGLFPVNKARRQFQKEGLVGLWWAPWRMEDCHCGEQYWWTMAVFWKVHNV